MVNEFKPDLGHMNLDLIHVYDTLSCYGGHLSDLIIGSLCVSYIYA